MQEHTLFDFNRYHRMWERNEDYSQALARTNLAVRCWLGRVGDGYREDAGSPPRYRILTWMLANHIVQTFYRRTGVDVLPFSCGGMYGYGMSVGIKAESCNRRDIGETAWIACGSVRVDPKVGDERGYQLSDVILSGEDPLWAIDKAATVAVGSRWLDKCSEHHCQHKQDADIYLTVYQIITLLLAMGYINDAILGTFRHSINVAIISGILGKSIGLEKWQLEDIIMAGLLHDIGKITITLDILNKPGKLTEEEMALMKTHPANGYQFLLQYSQLPETVKRGILHHHERNDGSGYPEGLTKNKISYYGKIVAIADIYDAMTTDRVYRKKMTPFCVAEILVEQMYNQLDPNLCLAFLNNIKCSVSNSIVSLSNGQQGEVVYLHTNPIMCPIIKLVDGSFLDLAKNRDIRILDVVND